MSTTVTHTAGASPRPLDGIERVFNVDEVAAHIGITRQSAYRLIRDQKLRCIHVGRLVKVPESALVEYLRGSSTKAA